MCWKVIVFLFYLLPFIDNLVPPKPRITTINFLKFSENEYLMIDLGKIQRIREISFQTKTESRTNECCYLL